MINQTSQNNIYVVAESSLLATSVIESSNSSIKLTIDPLGLECTFIIENGTVLTSAYSGTEINSSEMVSMSPEINGLKIKIGFTVLPEGSYTTTWTVVDGDASIISSDVEVV